MLHAISNRVIWDEGGGPSHTTKFNPFEIAPSGLTTVDRKSTRLNSSHGYISYAVFCLKKKKKKKINYTKTKIKHKEQSTHTLITHAYIDPHHDFTHTTALYCRDNDSANSESAHIARLS